MKRFWEELWEYVKMILIVVVVVFLVGGSWMLETLLDFSRNLFSLM